MKKKNGVVKTYYDNGQLESRTNYKDSKLNGLHESWYENGKPRESTMYKDGVKRNNL